MSVRVAVVIVTLSVLSPCAGCRFLQFRDGSQTETVARPPDSPGRLFAVDSWLPNRDWSALADWESSQSNSDTGPYRWRLAPPSGAASAESDLEERELRRLCGGDRLVGWNALILLAQHNAAAAAPAAEKLWQLVVDPPSYLPTGEFAHVADAEEGLSPTRPSVQVSANLRAAAAEMWCRVAASQSTDPRSTLAPAGRLLAVRDSPLPIEVRAELFRSLGRWIPPGHKLPGVEHALQSAEDGRRTDVALRRAAIDACLMQALWHGKRQHAQPEATSDGQAAERFDAADWPATITNCELDPDGPVRCAYGQWLAAVGHPRAVAILMRQVDGSDPQVRDSALASLGLLGTEPARDELREQARHGTPWIRHIAVRALARWGCEELTPWITDPESLVRRTLAEELGAFPTPHAGIALQQLVTDDNPQVQWTAAEAVANWPPQLAAPVGFQGLRDGSPRTRHICLSHLPSVQGGEGGTLAVATREERIAAIARLAAKHNLPMTYLGETSRDPSMSSQAPTSDDRDRLDSLWNRVTSAPAGSPEYRDALDAISSSEAADRRRLEERLLESRPGELPELLERDLTAVLSPAYASLQDLDAKDVDVRRRAARRLAAYGTAASLPPAMVRKLAARLTDEQDRAVWLSAMDAVRLDATDESAQIALLAVNHAWPDIRILGCQYIGRHGRPEHAHWLLPLFEDDNRNVQVEAVFAAGRCHNPVVLAPPPTRPGEPSPPGLRELLSHSDPRLRFAAIVAASRLGDRTGMSKLIGLSRNDDAAVREDAVRAMGESGQSRFVEEIIRLAWTEPSDAVKRAMLGSLEQLIPSGAGPVGLADGGSCDDKIILWVRWWDGRHGPSSTVFRSIQNESLNDDRIP